MLHCTYIQHHSEKYRNDELLTDYLLTRPDVVLRGEESLDDGLLLGGGGGAAAAVELPVQQRDNPLNMMMMMMIMMIMMMIVYTPGPQGRSG